MGDHLINSIVPEFLNLGLIEEWLGEEKLNVVDSFNLNTAELLAKIEAYHSKRQTLLAFQQYLESRVQKED